MAHGDHQRDRLRSGLECLISIVQRRVSPTVLEGVQLPLLVVDDRDHLSFNGTSTYLTECKRLFFSPGIFEILSRFVASREVGGILPPVWLPEYC